MINLSLAKQYLFRYKVGEGEGGMGVGGRGGGEQESLGPKQSHKSRSFLQDGSRFLG